MLGLEQTYDFPAVIRLVDKPAIGSVYSFRRATPHDLSQIQEFLRNLSAETCLMRYMMPFGKLPEAVVERDSQRMIRQNPAEQITLLAFCTAENGTTSLCGVAELVHDGTMAAGEYEFGIVICDEHQGRKLGYGLSRRLIELGERLGVRRLQATLMDENYPMRHLFRKLFPGGTFYTRQGETFWQTDLQAIAA
jgi:acetyltransferase